MMSTRCLNRFAAAAACSALIALPSLHADAASDRDEQITDAGDWVQILLPLGGYVGAWITGDKEGAWQLTKALGGAGISAHVFKAIAARGRPDAKDDRSFPSGHTTAAFAGSEFIRIRYGNAWGIPATVAAAFVGYSRIRANKHFRDDVLAGASNGLLWNWFFTSPYEEALVVRPTVVEGGYRIDVSYQFDSEVRSRHSFSDDARWDFTLEFGPVSQDRNIFTAPAEVGSEIDLATAETEIDTTSRVTVQHYRGRHTFEGYVAPMELIEFDPGEIITGPLRFADVTFTPVAGTSFEGRYNLLEFRGAYRYRLLDTQRWSLAIGAGLQYIDTFLEIKQFTGTPSQDQVVRADAVGSEDWSVVGSARAEYRFSDRWSLRYEIDAGEHTYVNQGISLNWHAAPGWILGVGGRDIRRDFTSSTLQNRIEVGDFVLRASHSFF